MTETKTAPEPYADIAERFARETAKHEMTILHDDGLYRHIKFRGNPDWAYWYELITAPNSLTFRGDGESYVFHRLEDMFEFFRSPSGRISPDYWAEKLTSAHDSIKVFSEDRFKQLVKEHAAEAIQSGQAPRGLAMAVRRDILENEDAYYEDGAREALRSFEHGAKTKHECLRCGKTLEIAADEFPPVEWRNTHLGHTVMQTHVEGFRFTDTWEWNFADFDWWFLWACHGIVAGIAQYDAAKAKAAKPVETVAVTAGAGV